MKILRSKAVWTALAGVITAIGLLFGSIDDAKADLPPSNFTPVWTYYGSTCTIPSADNRIYAKYEVGTVTGDGLYWERYGMYNGGATENKEVYVIKTFRHLGPTVHFYLYFDSSNNIRMSTTPKVFWSGNMDQSIDYYFERIAALVGDTSWDPTEWTTAQVHFVMDDNINGVVDGNKCVWTSTIQPYDE